MMSESENTKITVKKDENMIFKVDLLSLDDSKLLRDSFILAHSILFSSNKPKPILLELNPEKTRIEDIDIGLNDQCIEFSLHGISTESSKKKPCEQGIIKLNKTIVKFLSLLSEQNKIIERFNCEEQIIIKKSSNKIVFSTALILANKMVHFKCFNLKSSPEYYESMHYGKEPCPIDDKTIKSTKENKLSYIYDEKVVGGVIELLCKSTYAENNFNKPIEIVLNYLPTKQSESQELNQEEDVFLSDSENTNPSLKPKIKRMKHKLELTGKVTRSRNERYSCLIYLHANFKNISNTKAYVYEGFYYGSYNLSIKCDGEEVKYRTLARAKISFGKGNLKLNPGQTYSCKGVIHRIRDERFKDLKGDELVEFLRKDESLLIEYPLEEGKTYKISFKYDDSYSKSSYCEFMFEFNDLENIADLEIPGKVIDLISE